LRRGSDHARLPRSRRLPIVTAILLFVVLINILQLWLLTATVHAQLSGNESVVTPAGLASLGCFLLNAGLLWYLVRLER
jgi:hypothetical protein